MIVIFCAAFENNINKNEEDMAAISLREMCALVRQAYPDLDPASCNILVTLAASQEEGMCIALKQLVLLENGTPTTVRRRLSILIEKGYVEKVENPSDRRSPFFVATRKTCARIDGCRGEMSRVFREFEKRAG